MSELEAWRVRDAAALIHPQHDPAAIAQGHVWVSGQGATLTDADGRVFLDGLAGLWNVLAGYDCQPLVEAATRQLSILPFASLYAGSSHRPAIELAELLAEVAYPRINKFYFTGSGAEANEAAFKAAWLYWIRRGQPKKRTIVALRGSYHGTTLATAAATGVDRYSEAFGGRIAGFAHSPGFDSPQADRRLAETLDRLDPATVAAVIAEPVQATAGTWAPDQDVWPAIQTVCRSRDVLLILDEVVTGWGRMGDWFALGDRGIAPDLLTMAKGLTSGYLPLGAVGLADPIAEVLDHAAAGGLWQHGQTASGHPAACAVALAQGRLLRKGLLQSARRLAADLERLASRLAQHPGVLAVRCAGVLAGIDVQATDPPELVGLRLRQAMSRRGLVTRTRGATIHLAPALVTTAEQLAAMVAIVGDSIDEVVR